MAEPIHTNMWPLPMTTNADVLTLTQWLSPAYPVGAFAYSHGLEAVIQSGEIRSGPQLQDWLADVLSHGGGRSDCVLLRMAYGASDRAELLRVNDIALAFAPCAERLLETTQQGVAFGKATAAIFDQKPMELTYPVAVGFAAASLKIDSTLTAAMYLHAMTSNLVSAAMRLMKLGQTEGQAIVATLAALCEQIAQDTKDATEEALHSSAFLSDISAMRHEALQPRIFRT